MEGDFFFRGIFRLVFEFMDYLLLTALVKDGHPGWKLENPQDFFFFMIIKHLDCCLDSNPIFFQTNSLFSFLVLFFALKSIF